MLRIFDDFLFRRRFGFSKNQLSSLYVELVGRDDIDWATLNRNGLSIGVKNTEIGMGFSRYSIGGSYHTGADNKVFEHDGEKWELVLDVNDWRKVARSDGEWQHLIRMLVK